MSFNPRINDGIAEDEAVLRAFVMRQPRSSHGLASEPLGGQRGAWTLRSNGFGCADGAPMPFAAIYDALPSVVIVPSGVSAISGLKELRDSTWFFAEEAGLRVEMNNRALMQLGECTRAKAVGEWYAELERRNAPDPFKLLILDEVAPDPRGPSHHFYAEPVTSGDYLFRAVTSAVGLEDASRSGESKENVIEHLTRAGLGVRYAVHEPTPFRLDFESQLQERGGLLYESIQQLSPDHVIVFGRPLLKTLDRLGILSAIPVMHLEPITAPRTKLARTILRELVPQALGIAPTASPGEFDILP